MKATITIKQPTVGKFSEKPLQSSELEDNQKVSLTADTVITVREVLEYEDDHVRVVTDYPCPIWIYLPHVVHDLPDRVFLILPVDKIARFIGNVKYANQYVTGINRTLTEFNITTPARYQQFMAQLAHESGGFRYKEEIASGKAYEGRRDLGNIVAGDGVRFKGRGLIQLTGRHNYGVAGKALGLDLIKNPQLASTDENAPRIAGWYWDSRGLNKYADNNSITGFREITRRINGGYNGWKDRLRWWDKAKQTL